MLVMCFTTHAFACHVYAMPHIVECGNAWHCEHMQLVVCKIVVGLNFLGHFFKAGPLFEFHVNHAAMDALAQWDGHGEGVFYALLAACHHRVTHRTTWPKVGI